MEIQDLQSYNLFQEINDTFQLISTFVVRKEGGLEIKNTFIITKQDKIIINEEKTDEDVKLVVKWLDNERIEIIQKSKECIKLTEENFTKFKAENPTIKEEIKERVKDLKKVIKFFNALILEPLNYESFSKLKMGPDINSDYAGITVTETKYYLI